jgi:N4-gp56 family major capsid protein
MPFTTNLSGTAELDVSAVLEFDKQFIIAAADEGIMEQLVSYKKEIGAKSIDLTKYGQLALATTPLVETDDVVSEAMSDSQILITPQEYGKAVTTTKLISLQSGGKADLAAARVVGVNMGRTQDKLAILVAEASANFLTVDGGAEAALDAADIMTTTFLNQLYNKLARASVLPLVDGMFVAVMHDDVIHDLRNSAGAGSWVDINKYAKPEAVLRNEVGMLCGFKVLRDNNITISADAGAGAVDTYRTLCLAFNGLGKGVSDEPHGTLTGPFDKLGRFINVGWTGCFNYKIVDQDALWVGVTASSVGVNV